MVTILDSSTILVDILGDFFTVWDIDSGEKKRISGQHFLGNLYKYESAFESCFLKVFPDKRNILLTKKASKKVHELIDFNRIDT